MTIHPYLTFFGDCEEAFNFYKSIFGGEFQVVSRYNEMPPDEQKKFADIDGDYIMHISYDLGNITLMGSDTGGKWAENVSRGSDFSLSINTESKEEANQFFEKLSKDGSITMPMGETFWGSYFGMLSDKFGIQWMVNFDPKTGD